VQVGELESLRKGLEYYSNVMDHHKSDKKICLQPKYMGSRINVYLFREVDKCFSVSRNGYLINIDPNTMKKVYLDLITRLGNYMESHNIMMMIVEIIFWLSTFLLLYSYVLYPLLLRLLAIGKKQNVEVYDERDPLPDIAILLAVHNEQQVIDRKITSTFNTAYPLEKITFFIGSDASTDNTNNIIQALQVQYPNLKFKEYENRVGKASIINQLVQEADAQILIMTDANVEFERDTLFHLVKHFKNDSIAQVGANITSQKFKKEGISLPEKTYMKYEKNIKYLEGIIWGTMVGAFGGCYAMRKELHTQVPDKFLMEDFYISMRLLENGKKAIQELDAICYEDVSDLMLEEFRRKSRISAGNFQNLFVFKRILWPPFSGLAFSFMSHKVLRWLGPFWIMFAFFSSLYLMNQHFIYEYMLYMQISLMSLSIADFILKHLNIHLKILRFVAHFYFMNLALLVGFMKFLKGVETGVWEPTLRNQ